MDEEKLQEELQTRLNRRSKGYCDYCNRRGDTSPCEFGFRHEVATGILKTLDTAHEQPLNAKERKELLDAGYCPACRLPGESEPCDKHQVHNEAYRIWGELEMQRAKQREEDLSPKEGDDRVLAAVILSKLERTVELDAESKQATIAAAKDVLCDAPKGSAKAAVVSHLMSAVGIVAHMVDLKVTEKTVVIEGFPVPSEESAPNDSIRPDQGYCPLAGTERRDLFCKRQPSTAGDKTQLCEFFGGSAREKHTEELYSLCKKADIGVFEGGVPK